MHTDSTRHFIWVKTLAIRRSLLHLHVNDFQHFTFQVKKENCLHFLSELKPSQLFYVLDFEKLSTGSFVGKLKCHRSTEVLINPCVETGSILNLHLGNALTPLTTAWNGSSRPGQYMSIHSPPPHLLHQFLSWYQGVVVIWLHWRAPGALVANCKLKKHYTLILKFSCCFLKFRILFH